MLCGPIRFWVVCIGHIELYPNQYMQVHPKSASKQGVLVTNNLFWQVMVFVHLAED